MTVRECQRKTCYEPIQASEHEEKICAGDHVSAGGFVLHQEREDF